MALTTTTKIPNELDEQLHVFGPADKSKPLYYEKYGDEVRESYSEARHDKMHFRLVDPKGNETRLFNKGRADDVRECTSYLLDSRNRGVIFGGSRPDGCIEYQRTVSAVEKNGNNEENSVCIMYGLKFEGRADGVRRVALSLRTGVELDHGADTPAILFREKVWHCAIVVDPRNKANWNGIAESFYERRNKSLRIVLEDVVSGAQTQKNYSCLEPNNEDTYERARFAIMTAMQLFIGVERDLFLHLPLFVPGTSESDATAVQNKKLEDAMQKMFNKFDEMSSNTVNPWAN
jgi:hypothetical protein